MRSLLARVPLVCAVGILLGLPAGAPAQASPEPIPPAERAASPAPFAGAGDAAIVRRSDALGWVLVLGGAVAGGAVGFGLAAPDCLDGSTGCGSKPLVYLVVGSAAGAAAGWVLRRLIGSD